MHKKGTGDHTCLHIDGLVQERRNSSALAMELRLSSINPSISSRIARLLHDEKVMTRV